MVFCHSNREHLVPHGTTWLWRNPRLRICRNFERVLYICGDVYGYGFAFGCHLELLVALGLEDIFVELAHGYEVLFFVAQIDGYKALAILALLARVAEDGEVSVA